MPIYVIYKLKQHNNAVNQYIHYVNCIYADSETNYFMMLLVAIALNCENSSERDKLLVNERDSECHKAVVSDSEVYEADEVSVVRLVGEIEYVLDELTEVDYDEVSEGGEADELDEDCEVRQANE